MKTLRNFLFLVIFFCSCKNDLASNSGSDGNSASIQTNSKEEFPVFNIDTRIDREGTPHSEVSVLVGDKKLEVAKVNSCEAIRKKDYENYGIPVSALDACGGWWAGSGDYFYIIEDRKNVFTVMQGTIDESIEGNKIEYRMVLMLTNKIKPVN